MGNMTTLTNYDVITSKDGPLEDTNQDKKEATSFLRSILRHKFLVTLIIVVVGSVVFMTNSAIHQEVATTTLTTSLLRQDGAVGYMGYGDKSATLVYYGGGGKKSAKSAKVPSSTGYTSKQAKVYGPYVKEITIYHYGIISVTIWTYYQ